MRKSDDAVEKYTLVIGGLSQEDRDNPNLLRNLVHEERIKNLNKRVGVPTISSTMRNRRFHQTLTGHDVQTLPVWENMPLYDHHFLGRLYDKYGNCRNLNRGRIMPGESNLLDTKPLKLPPMGSSMHSKDVYLQPASHTSRFSFRSQWTNNQRHFETNFRRSSKPFI